MVYYPFSEGSQKRFNKRYKSNITFSVRALHPSLHFIKLFLKAQILHFSCSLQLLKAGEISPDLVFYNVIVSWVATSVNKQTNRLFETLGAILSLTLIRGEPLVGGISV